MKPYPGHVLRAARPALPSAPCRPSSGPRRRRRLRCPTEAAVRGFQARHRPALQADGEVGPSRGPRCSGSRSPPAAKTLAERAFANAVNLLGVMEVGGNNTGPMVTRIIKANGGGPGAVVRGLRAYCYRLAGSDIVKGAQRLWAFVPWITRTAVKVTTSPCAAISSATTGTTTASTTTSSCSTGGSSRASRSRRSAGTRARTRTCRTRRGRRRCPPPERQRRARRRLPEGDAMLLRAGVPVDASESRRATERVDVLRVRVPVDHAQVRAAVVELVAVLVIAEQSVARL
jgi:hypothetical protein